MVSNLINRKNGNKIPKGKRILEREECSGMAHSYGIIGLLVLVLQKSSAHMDR